MTKILLKIQYLPLTPPHLQNHLRKKNPIHQRLSNNIKRYYCPQFSLKYLVFLFLFFFFEKIVDNVYIYIYIYIIAKNN
jgi:hypothetical protein